MHISTINFCGQTKHLRGHGGTKPERYEDLGVELKAACLARREGINAPNYQALPFVRGSELGVKYTIEGEPANFENNPITKEHIENLLQNFYLMDKMGLYHRNLSLPNIFYSESGKVEIGSMREAAKYIQENGGFSLKNSEILSFTMPSNAEAFETQSLCRYLSRIEEDDKKDELIRTYLKEKSDYHKFRADFLQAKGFKDTDRAVLFETAQSEVFKAPSDGIVNYTEWKLEAIRTRKNATIMWHKANGCLDGKINPTERFASVVMMLSVLKNTISLRDNAALLSENAASPAERQYFAFEKELLDLWVDNIYADTKRGGEDNFCNKDFANGKGLFLGRTEDRELFDELYREIDPKSPAQEAEKSIDAVIEYYKNLIADWTPEENQRYKMYYLKQTVSV